jgi:hypothetical protein
MAAAGYAIALKLTGVPSVVSGIATVDKSLAKLNTAGRTALLKGGLIDKNAAKAATGALGNLGFVAVGAGSLIQKSIGAGVKEVEKLGREVKSTTDQISGLVPVLGGLAAFTTAAGIGKTVTNFAAAGGEIRRTSGALGLNTQELQANRIAWRLAGLQAGQFDESFAGVQQSLVEAQAGRPEGAAAIGAARQFKGLNLGLPPLAFMKQLANKIKELDSLGVSKVTQRGLLEVFHITPDQLSLFERGGDAIAGLVVQGEKLVAMDADAAARGQALETSLTGLGAAATKVGFDIADGLTQKGVVPAIEGMKNWLLELDKSPTAVKNLTTAVEGLIGVLGVLAATPILKFLIRNPLTAGAIGAIAGGVALKGVTPPEDAKKWLDEAHKNKAGEAPTEFPAWWNQLRNWVFGSQDDQKVVAQNAQRSVSVLEDIRDYLKTLFPSSGVPHWGAGGAGSATGATAPHYPHGSLGKLGIVDTPNARLAMDFFENGMGLGHARAAGIVGVLQQESGPGLNPAIVNATGHKGIYQADAARQAHFGGSSNIMDQLNAIRWEFLHPNSMGGEGNAFAAIMAARTPTETAIAMRRFERGGDYGDRDIEAAEKLNKITLGAAPPMPSPITGGNIPERLRNLPGSEDMNPGDGGGNASSAHHVQVEFLNAPQGMRSGLAKQTGDASFSLRTRYAMDSVW